jgi:hypothetical protein
MHELYGTFLASWDWDKIVYAFPFLCIPSTVNTVNSFWPATLL